MFSYKPFFMTFAILARDGDEDGAYIQRVGDGESNDSRRGRVPGERREEGGEQHNAVANELEAHGEPAVGYVVQVAALHVGVHLNENVYIFDFFFVFKSSKGQPSTFCSDILAKRSCSP